MRRTLVVLSLLAALTGCDDDNNSPSSPTSPSPNPSGSPQATMALVSATCVPSIVPAVPSAFAGFAWQVSWVLEVRESAGVNGRINTLQVTIADQQVMFMDAAGITAVAGSANVAARGALPIPLTLPYNLPDGGKLANITATINFTDARGNVLVTSGQLRTF